MSKPVCDTCQQEIVAWIDAFQGFGPITRWRQYQTTHLGRATRSAEMFSIHVEDRAALIRRQIRLIRSTCNHLDEAVA